MFELSSFKAAKPLGKTALIVVIYALTAISFLLLLRPRMLELQRIEKEISHEQYQVQMMERLIKQRRSIETDFETLTTEVQDYEAIIPGAFNLLDVLEAVKEWASVYDLNLIKLDYEPLKTQGLKSWYRMSLEVTGGCGDVLAGARAMAAAFPASSFTKTDLAGTIEGDVFLRTDLDLFVVPPEWAASVPWQRPVWEQAEWAFATPFGIPLWNLQELYATGIQVVGVVRVHGGDHRALIRFNGAQEWKAVGDALGIGTVEEIAETELIININGVKLSIEFGGESK